MEAHLLEKRAIEKARLLLYPTRWAADSAIKDYGADPQKVRVIPFGANIEHPPAKRDVLNKTNLDRCVLLFLVLLCQIVPSIS